jgi:hypothetical protein
VFTIPTTENKPSAATEPKVAILRKILFLDIRTTFVFMLKNYTAHIFVCQKNKFKKSFLLYSKLFFRTKKLG